MDCRAEDRCASTWDEEHDCGNGTGHESLDSPDPLPTKRGVKNQFQHVLSVGSDADRLRQSELRQINQPMHGAASLRCSNAGELDARQTRCGTLTPVATSLDKDKLHDALDEAVIVIDEDELEASRRDPRVHALFE